MFGVIFDILGYQCCLNWVRNVSEVTKWFQGHISKSTEVFTYNDVENGTYRELIIYACER